MPDPNEKERLRRLEKAVSDLQDNLVVLAEIERRQSTLLKDHSERIVNTEKNLVEVTEKQKRTEDSLADVADKLHAIIDVLDGIIRKPPPSQ